MRLLRGLDRLIGYVVSAAKWLALSLVTLLFLQWPLRDLFRGYSREANDLGQVVFALFVAVSVTAATRAGTHLAADLLARQYSATTRRRLYRASRLGIKRLGDSSNPGRWAAAPERFSRETDVALDWSRWRPIPAAQRGRASLGNAAT